MDLFTLSLISIPMLILVYYGLKFRINMLETSFKEGEEYAKKEKETINEAFKCLNDDAKRKK